MLPLFLTCAAGGQARSKPGPIQEGCWRWRQWQQAPAHPVRSLRRLGAADKSELKVFIRSEAARGSVQGGFAGHLPLPFTYAQVQMVSKITTVNELKLNSADILCCREHRASRSGGSASSHPLLVPWDLFIPEAPSGARNRRPGSGISWDSRSTRSTQLFTQYRVTDTLLHQFQAAIALAAACQHITRAQLFAWRLCCQHRLLESPLALSRPPCRLPVIPLSFQPITNGTQIQKGCADARGRGPGLLSEYAASAHSQPFLILSAACRGLRRGWSRWSASQHHGR